jgi:hypothetical protein
VLRVPVAQQMWYNEMVSTMMAAKDADAHADIHLDASAVVDEDRYAH